MKTLVKICGLTRLEDARYCAAAGADYLGFVLAERSPRNVSTELAREIVGWVYGPRTVGVFVDATPELVNQIVQDIGFDLAQLHGDETPEECRQIDVPVIKAIGVGPSTTARDLEAEVERYRGSAQHILLDTTVAGDGGGTGRIFDWSVASDVVLRQSTFVAGGLRPENVQSVVKHLGPFAVDVSSGVEESPGVKSFEKVSALINAVRSAST